MQKYLIIISFFYDTYLKMQNSKRRKKFVKKHLQIGKKCVKKAGVGNGADI